MAHPKLLLLGPPRVEVDGHPLEVDTCKAIALLAYLAMTGRRHTRDALCGLLWPEHGQTRARAALRRTLSSLARARAEGWLEVERETVGLVSGEAWVDVDRFRSLLAECAAHGHPAGEVCPACLSPLSEAVALYRDDFLAGFGLRDSFAFDDWQFFQAEELRRELAGALERLARGYAEAREWEPAIGHARRLLLLDPLHEPAHRLLMRLYALADERAAALRQYRECVRVLERELGVAPLEETTLLYRTIKKGSPVSPPTDGAGSPATETPPAAVTAEESPLVGRAAEWAALEEAYGAAGGGAVVAIEGEAGIGKTRLAEEFLARVREGGAATLAVRCYAGETDLAYGPFVEALGILAERSDLAGRLAAAPAHALGEASRLLPPLAGLLPEVPDLPPMDTPGARSRFFEGVGAVLLAALGGERPGVFFLDDLHWADEASLDLLAYLTRRLGGRPLLVMVAWREELVPEDHRLRAVLVEGKAGIVRPSRLDRAAVEELVSSAGRARDLGPRLYDETEGLPLFLAEYLAAMGDGTLEADGGAWSLPEGVRGLLRGRLRTVGETAGQVLTAAAVVGRSFDFDTVRAASGRGEEETLAALEELASRRLIREVGGEGPTYDFDHDKLRTLVYEETSLARKRLLHRRVAAALAGRLRGREAGPLLGQIARHHRLAGQDTEAAEYSRLAGDQARSLHANSDALAHYEEALALGHPDAAALHEAVGDLRTRLGEYGAALASYEAAAASGGSEAVAVLEHKIGNVHARRGERDLARSHYESALEMLGGSDAVAAGDLARLYADLSLLYHGQDEPDRAAGFARRALELAERAGDPRARAQAHNMLGILAGKAGEREAVLRHLEESLALAEALGDPEARVAALNNLALARGSGGETGKAIELAGAALDLCVTLGDRHREAALHNNLADLLHTAGREEESMAHLKRAVEIFAEVGERGELQPEIWKLVEW